MIILIYTVLGLVNDYLCYPYTYRLSIKPSNRLDVPPITFCTERDVREYEVNKQLAEKNAMDLVKQCKTTFKHDGKETAIKVTSVGVDGSLELSKTNVHLLSTPYMMSCTYDYLQFMTQTSLKIIDNKGIDNNIGYQSMPTITY
ncbi:unnamed protein product [Oppiella nova]|uniref:Uncharacterized protein n=1 Tax=Oppiella nova TaxID=334625 RepID=A0A7R9LW00_9ACAR|nr:unnamed protein product [Oppiella nova]CAG2167468.1 unnamed protein product [Oppiella nova]